ncbi:phage tail protein [Solimonas sp. SE-A11]|uniref:phage tail protein n=1 Tax=Solimonas sp. SE-A11 TaxID=3054954 RepID=UPI00259CF3B8|nr:tail fiber protein [Solimonas sp. SE-A11]MDM4772593.1 tail fiber protein [Solimonas sp. SE-A11]
MSDPYIGEIRLFGGDYAPPNWALCQGQLLPISDYDVLYNLIGTRYGGDGVTNFALPDLRGRAPVHQGAGPGLTLRVMGEQGGLEDVTLTHNQIPSHQHAFMASTSVASDRQPSKTRLLGAVSNTTDGRRRVLYLPNTVTGRTDLEISPLALAPVGGGQPHANLMPSLVVSFIICVNGLYPSHF